jgi:hypothetical protein
MKGLLIAALVIAGAGSARADRAFLIPYHVADNSPEAGELGLRFLISPAVRDVFIPHRMKILIDFLNSGKAAVHSQ